MKNQLTFQSTVLTVISHNGQTYISASDLACALRYANVQSIANIYNRNQDEFTTDMSEVINSVTSGNLQTTQRIFSLRGCHLIAMFARTAVAKDFRKWVLDILDKEALQNSARIAPLDPNQIQLSKDKYIELLETQNQLLKQAMKPQQYKLRLSAEEKSHIFRLHQQGLSTGQIVQQSGRSESAVRAVIRENLGK